VQEDFTLSKLMKAVASVLLSPTLGYTGRTSSLMLDYEVSCTVANKT